MKNLRTCLVLMVGILIGGILSHTQQYLFQSQANAQQVVGGSNKKTFDLNSLGITKETLEKLRAANDALNAAVEALKNEGKYKSPTKLVNASLVLAGGGDSYGDLSKGMGVDPETYGMLYAGFASEDIEDDVGFDNQGRLLYKNQVVRIMSQKKFSQHVERREAIQDFNPFTFR